MRIYTSRPVERESFIIPMTAPIKRSGAVLTNSHSNA